MNFDTALRVCNLCDQESQRVIFVKNGFELVKCPLCGLVYVGNPPSRAELESMYSFDAGYFANYQDKSADDTLALTKATEKYGRIKEHKTRGRILDIGCGPGFFLKVAKEHGWATYGVDISRDTSELARTRYGLQVFTGTLDQANLVPSSFDAVTMWDTIEHVENPVQTMLAVNELLKHDGIVAISTPNIDGLFPRLSYHISSLTNQWRHPEPPHHLFQFSKKTVHKLLKLAGFHTLEMYDKRVPIQYSFGIKCSLYSLKRLIKSPKKFLYSALFVPIALLGPLVHSGDWITVVAKKDPCLHSGQQQTRLAKAGT